MVARKINRQGGGFSKRSCREAQIDDPQSADSEMKAAAQFWLPPPLDDRGGAVNHPQWGQRTIGRLAIVRGQNEKNAGKLSGGIGRRSVERNNWQA